MEDEYTDGQRDKFLFNHLSYLGEEDCTAIFGLADLNGILTSKDGTSLSLRTLLKSLPGTPGLSCSRLFQVVDPNAAQTCDLVTFHRCDRPFIEARREKLEDKILSYLASGQAKKVVSDPLEGLQFVGAYHKKGGKVVRVHNPSKSHQEFVNHAELLLNSPPKKRPSTATAQPVRVDHSKITYSGILQAQTTNTRSVEVQPHGLTLTTTTRTSQTITFILETRFQTIEREVQDQKALQGDMDERLQKVGSSTLSISQDITTMMAFWKIPPMGKRKLDDLASGNVGHAHPPTFTEQGTGDANV